jgi:hypothetical protein
MNSYHLGSGMININQDSVEQIITQQSFACIREKINYHNLQSTCSYKNKVTVSNYGSFTHQCSSFLRFI